jgi:hypothetical protein
MYLIECGEKVTVPHTTTIRRDFKIWLMVWLIISGWLVEEIMIMGFYAYVEIDVV